MHDVSGKLKVTRCGYASDSFDIVFYGAKKIEKAQGKIKCIGGSYGIDRQGNKFYKGEEVDSIPSAFGKKTVSLTSVVATHFRHRKLSTEVSRSIKRAQGIRPLA